MKIIKLQKKAQMESHIEITIGNLNNLSEYCLKLKSLLEDGAELEGWMMDKISTSKDDIADVKHAITNRDFEMDEKEAKKDGLWDNIRKKRERGEKPAKPGDDDYPDKKQWDKLTASLEEDGLHAEAAEYQGKEVTLNKPFRTPGGPKKFSVYVKNDKGNVVKVNFGDPNMEIKRDDPERKKNFRARHNCSEKKDKTSPGYWSCKMWSGTNVSDMT